MVSTAPSGFERAVWDRAVFASADRLGTKALRNKGFQPFAALNAAKKLSRTSPNSASLLFERENSL